MPEQNRATDFEPSHHCKYYWITDFKRRVNLPALLPSRCSGICSDAADVLAVIRRTYTRKLIISLSPPASRSHRPELPFQLTHGKENKA